MLLISLGIKSKYDFRLDGQSDVTDFLWIGCAPIGDGNYAALLEDARLRKLQLAGS